jgi:hypothetical protein
MEWQHEFDPEYVAVEGKVANLLHEVPGLEATIFPTYSEEGCLINFPPKGEPKFVWQHSVIVHGEHDERYDHYGGTIDLDLSRPEMPVIWNLRHHRCRGFNALTGDTISTLIYEIDGRQRRNYGPLYITRYRDNDQFACVFGEWFNAMCMLFASRTVALTNLHGLLPASEFFEKGSYFRQPDGELFCFAGLWECWDDGEGDDLFSCTLLTTEPNAAVKDVGHHRMPVLLTSLDDYRLWMNPDIMDPTPFVELFKPFSKELITRS